MRSSTKNLPNEQASSDGLVTLLPRLFAASHLQHLAWYGFSDLLPFARDLIEREAPLPRRPTVTDLLEGAFKVMRLRYPVEYVYKAYLLKRRLFGTHSPRTTACYFEHPAGNARADMLLVNGEATVFEIKSRFDQVTRLRSQLEEYYKCFTRVTIVTEDGDAEAYLDRLPTHVGVATLTPRFSISTKRSPSRHRDGLEHASLFRMLHQSERHCIAEALGLRVSRLDPAVRYRSILDRFSSAMSVEEAHARVVAALRVRQRTESLAERCRSLPESLHVAAFSYYLRKREWTALFRVLSSAPCEATEKERPRVLPLPTWQAGRDTCGSGS